MVNAPLTYGLLNRALSSAYETGDYSTVISLIMDNQSNILFIDYGEELLNRAAALRNLDLFNALLSIPYIRNNLNPGIAAEWPEGQQAITSLENDIVNEGIDDFDPNLINRPDSAPLLEFEERENQFSPPPAPQVNELSLEAAAAMSLLLNEMQLLNDEQNDQAGPVRPRQFLFAVQDGDLETVESYIEQFGRNRLAMNFTDPETGDNALLLAAATGNQQIINALMDTQMFDLNYSNTEGQNAAQIAEQNGHVEVAAELAALISDRQQREESIRAGSPQQSSTSAPAGTFAERLERLNISDNDIPLYLKCPFSNDIMTEPVVIHGETFDKSSLDDMFSDPETFQGRSPKGHNITREEYEGVVVCTAFKDAIEAYVVNLENQHQPKTPSQAIGEAYQQQMSSLMEQNMSAQSSSTHPDDDTLSPHQPKGPNKHR